MFDSGYLNSIWRNFIPFESFQVFQRGGYFAVDVVPDQLAVVSLNTLYFYDSNKGELFTCIVTSPFVPLFRSCSLISSSTHEGSSGVCHRQAKPCTLRPCPIHGLLPTCRFVGATILFFHLSWEWSTLMAYCIPPTHRTPPTVRTPQISRATDALNYWKLQGRLL